MVLAIECDGATYHSSESARDRDRLRQDKLEDLGWTFHRIWSQDWFQHKDRVIASAKEAYAAAVHALDEPRERPPVMPRPSENGGDRTVAAARTRPRPFWKNVDSIAGYTQAELDQMVRYVESDTLLRTEDELIGEVIHELGFQKRGTRIVSAIIEAIRRVRAAQAFDRAREATT